ncbi:MAG: hypothetical protein ABI361_00430 [Nitrososphaera sp.]|jgi:hypothetical protein
MATALTEPRRLVEYPDDLRDCRSVRYQERDLLYYVVKTPHAEQHAAALVVLGYKIGEKTDVVIKDLIETIDAGEQASARRRIIEALHLDGKACVLFI